MSLRIVQIDRTPKVSWQESPESLTRLQPPSKGQTSHRPSKDLFASQSNRFHNQSTSYDHQFPVSKLAPVSQQPYTTQYNPPTPPDDEPDPMDWTPTHTFFQPVPVHALSQKAEITSTASPFYGRIPAAPQSQAQILRNPQNQPSFRKSTVGRKQNFFGRLPPQKKQQKPGVMHLESQPSFQMAPPKFFPRDDFATDAGLADLFDTAFSLKDEPPEIRAAREQQQQLSQGRGAWTRITQVFVR